MHGLSTPRTKQSLRQRRAHHATCFVRKGPRSRCATHADQAEEDEALLDAVFRSGAASSGIRWWATPSIRKPLPARPAFAATIASRRAGVSERS